MMPLILLPGMMCDARLFAPQIDTLAPREVIVPALSDHSSVQDLAAQILEHAPYRFALGGLSMGGIVAMEMVRQAPDRVKGLALMDTNPLAEGEAMRARRAPQMANARAGKLFSVMREEMKPNYLSDSPRKPQILDLCMSMAMDLGPNVFCRQSIALRERPDQSETLRSYAGPSLVLCGREDQLCPVERHQLMHDLLPNSSLRIIEGAGHLPTLEQPDDTTSALAGWLKELDHE